MLTGPRCERNPVAGGGAPLPGFPVMSEPSTPTRTNVVSDTCDIGEVRVEPYTGSRSSLRPLFELAEDSPAQLDTYLTAGRVLLARRGAEVVGHLQLVETDRPGEVELKNMAVREDLQGQGIGAQLVRAAVELVAAEAASVLVVATAAADTGNLRFYQRQGFRMRAIERDAFTPATGYPSGIRIDGIELRDRVWLDQQVTHRRSDRR
jgi:ribosomal protein S18 acetylase RimI-like enzyme